MLDKNGDPHICAATPTPRGYAPGVRITFVGGPGSAPQTLYYFTTDLSNEGIRAQPGFMKFCASQNVGLSLLKSASYLMFQSGFENVRDFLLTHSRALIEDDSGIPLRAFDPAKWDLRLFGTYSTPIDLFKEHFQPDLQALYSAEPGAAAGIRASAIAGAGLARPSFSRSTSNSLHCARYFTSQRMTAPAAHD